MEALPVIGGGLRRYSVESFLAAGGMGALYVGKQFGAAGFERPVVLKQLRSELVTRSDCRARFIREAKISASLDHVNVVRTIDLVRMGKSFFIVMEYVPGVDLRLLLRRLRLLRKRLDAAPALHIGLEVLAGLAYAHPLGVLHRDISPSNILLSRSGDVKLSDFGIATVRSPLGFLEMSAGAPPAYGHRNSEIAGKLGYTAPEQLTKGWADPRSDLFSVAVCLYEALTGERLFYDDGIECGMVTADELYARPVAPIWRKRPDLPLRDLDGVLRVALQPDPAARFASAEEFASGLREVVRRWRLQMSPADFAAYLTSAAGPPASWRDQPAMLGVQTRTHPLASAEAHPLRAHPASLVGPPIGVALPLTASERASLPAGSP